MGEFFNGHFYSHYKLSDICSVTLFVQVNSFTETKFNFAVFMYVLTTMYNMDH